MDAQIKRVCIVLIKDSTDEDGEVVKAYTRVMKTTKPFADKLVKDGNWAYCKKGKLKSFIKQQVRLYKNEKTIGFLQESTGKSFGEYKVNGKTYVDVPTFKIRHKEGELMSVNTGGYKHNKIDHIIYSYNKAGKIISAKKTIQLVPIFKRVDGSKQLVPETKLVTRPYLFKGIENQVMGHTGVKRLVVAF